jgi:hypothetical protein
VKWEPMPLMDLTLVERVPPVDLTLTERVLQVG